MPPKIDGKKIDKDRNERERDGDLKEEEAKDLEEHVYDACTSALKGFEADRVSSSRTESQASIREASESTDNIDVISQAQDRAALSEAQARLESDDAGSRDYRRRNVCILLGVGGLSFLAIAAVVSVVLATGSSADQEVPSPKDDPSCPKPSGSFSERVAERVKEWNEMPERGFWSSYRDWIIEEQASWCSQEYVATTLGFAAEGETPDEAITASGAEQLAEQYERDSDLVALYDAAASLRFDEKIMTRKQKLGSLARFLRQQIAKEAA